MRVKYDFILSIQILIFTSNGTDISWHQYSVLDYLWCPNRYMTYKIVFKVLRF
jgi:hypothetical protein